MRFRAILFGLMAAIVSASCLSQDATPVHIDIDYQLRCIPEHGCSNFPGLETIFRVNGIDGIDGLTADCEVGEQADQLYFLASFVELEDRPAGEIILNAIDSECKLRVREGNNEYEKECRIRRAEKVSCFGEEHDENHPCQIAALKSGDTVTGKICCRSFAPRYENPDRGDLSLVAPNTFDKPVKFEIEHCR